MADQTDEVCVHVKIARTGILSVEEIYSHNIFKRLNNASAAPMWNKFG